MSRSRATSEPRLSPATGARLLVVEDDPAIGRALRSSLDVAGYYTRWVRSGAEARAAASTRHSAGQNGGWDLILLDLGLPDADGLDLCEMFREADPSCVIVILTARHEEIDVVLGLEVGADDYLVKPVRLAELQARLAAHLRRRGTDDASAAVIDVGDLRIDLGARRVYLGGVEFSLRLKEFELLARLAAEVGSAVSRSTLMTDVWDEHWFGSTKTLDVHLVSLRRKLASAADGTDTNAPVISTLRGHGFRLENSVRDHAGR